MQNNIIDFVKSLFWGKNLIILLLLCSLILFFISCWWGWGIQDLEVKDYIELIGIIISFLMTVGMFWVGYIANREAIERKSGVKNIKGEFKYSKEKSSFYFFLRNGGLFPHSIGAIQNDKEEIIIMFSGEEEGKFSCLFDRDSEKITVTSKKNPQEGINKSNSPIIDGYHVSSPLVLTPGMAVPPIYVNDIINKIPLNPESSKRDILENFIRTIKNSNKLFVVDYLCREHQISSKKEIQKALEDFRKHEKELER